MSLENNQNELPVLKKVGGQYDKLAVQKIVEAIEGGMHRSEVCLIYGLSRSTISNWMREYGSASYKVSKQGRLNNARKRSMIRAIREGRMTLQEARLAYNIKSYTALLTILRQDEEKSELEATMDTQANAVAQGEDEEKKALKKAWCQAVKTMKQDYPDYSIKMLCGLFGKTRHAYYDRQWREQQNIFTEEIILHKVRQIRQHLPRVGTRKLQELLAPELATHQIEVGRDYLFDLLEAHKLLIRQRKRKVFTTDSRHWMRKYSNLSSQLVIDRPEQLWVSDMTYIKIQNQWGYLSLITDAYSRKIMGYCLRSDMLAEGCIAALQMALANRSYQQQSLIHHSDRGSQYCCKQYVDMLGAAGVAIIMTENGDPYENALAERMNGIIKGEFNLYSSQLSFDQTYELVAQSIAAYNEIRPHSSCDYLTPNHAHQTLTPMRKRWKNYPRLAASRAGVAPLQEQAPARRTDLNCSPTCPPDY